MRLAAFIAAVFWAGAAIATPPNQILRAEFIEPTERYDHGVLGDAIEWGAMRVTFDACPGCDGARQIRQTIIRLPESRVFEDLAPRIIHDEFGLTAIMVVETDLRLGARLAIYSEDRLYHATPFIGQAHRWLAPIGAADLDGDGVPEIAYVEKPHLSKVLKVWRFTEAGLALVAEKSGLTNHRIGEDYISGGIRDCGAGPEMVTADGNWRYVMATRFDGKRLVSRIVAPFRGRASMDSVLACET